MPIKLLSQNLINQIAAGEVIERPSSVIKELVENSIDAGAGEISVSIIDAGKSFIAIEDDGVGMDKNALELCLMSHATSKLDAENLFDIQTFGFRGEALPSIASISRVCITSAQENSAWCIETAGSGAEVALSPSTRKKGSLVEVRDLFFATPARLKFLKSDSREADYCREVFQRTALAFRKVSLRFREADVEKYHYEATDDLQKRVCDVFGENFVENLFPLKAEKDGMRLHGFIGVPTFNKASSHHQYFFVNNRYVKDKVFASALKSAYAGLTPPGRYPVAIVFLEIPHNEVDVNAHPAKTEIRFRDAEKVRYFMVSSLKKALSSFGAGQQPTTELINNFFAKKEFAANAGAAVANTMTLSGAARSVEKNIIPPPGKSQEPRAREIFLANYTEAASTSHESGPAPLCNLATAEAQEYSAEKINLGNALFQLGNTYIVAENGHHLIVVDQHAAAERITLEKLKKTPTLDSQNLLMPDLCSLTKSQVELLQKNTEILLRCGIYFEKLAEDLVVLNSIPALLETCDTKSLMTDMADELSAFGDIYDIERKINAIFSVISCHGSLRAGKKLTIHEMNSLLRQMEDTENIAQCCHGRPSYVIITLEKLHKFFERS
ncbi:MAG: DNA mismatch repair endonuclease MutL [Holosporaceae bacterium]|jgi:DNA mismatch repair protein MutL|nr:DNA mismatch repair endonuclease MutL [Holosporaceae bacterium]